MATEFNSNISHMFEQLENFVSTKTVVGEPVTAGSVTLIPLVDVHFGLGGGSSGADDGSEKAKKEVKSGGGLWSNIKPSAVLVISDGNVQLVNIKHQDSINKLIDMIPSITSKFDLKALLGKKKKDDEAEGENDERGEQL